MHASTEFGNSSEIGIHPLPTNFEAFLPWACSQYQVEAFIHITKSEQASTEKKVYKPTKTQDDGTETPSDVKGSKPSVQLGIGPGGAVVNIHITYDANDRLVQLKFNKNQYIPSAVMRLISHIIQFYPHLTTISINKGLKSDGLYELSRIVSMSKITEIILDDTRILQANYDILLDKDNSITYISLARCNLNDTAVENLVSKLATSSVSILNLSSNRITDIGAMCVGNLLRSYRKLKYLNLASNMITDKGAVCILASLMKFTLNSDEIQEMKLRYIAYLRKKNYFIKQTMDKLRAADTERTVKRKAKPVSAPTKKSKGLDRAISVRSILPSVSNYETGKYHEKALTVANCSLGPFKNPFSQENTVTKDGIMYCLGNNVLCYLNLAYNSLTYFSVKKLHEVLCFQEEARRTPRGLINVSIEGNNLPEVCDELNEIDYILQSGLACNRTLSASMKKRPVKLNTK